ncbi:hypothetical protein J5N97_014754 [Dioscorea zingiberensis]|uniref:DCD domain-containing protein n=1 Tax=Dioscorea zingiberensis TaxID=325984 RepID=A0A9D5CSY7_9LILI|nr:hypothetical protein J5N97_014754 [Dioscorea zingiberensis]
MHYIDGVVANCCACFYVNRMSSLRKTQTNLVSANPPTSVKDSNSSVTARNLPKNDLGGVIFGCKHDTMMECLSKQLFGLPSSHFSYVRKIEHGLPLFLFNYSDRKMHGIYEAASCGQMNIDPYAWTDGGAERTSFPAQVQICIRMQCQPLAENQFKKVIKDNYYNQVRFWFELDHSQTEDLIALFRPSCSPTSVLPFLAPLKMSNIYDSLPTIEGEVIEHGKTKHWNCKTNNPSINLANESKSISHFNVYGNKDHAAESFALSLRKAHLKMQAQNALAEIVKVLVERTTALEKKQGEQELTIQQLRGRVSKLESNLNSFTTLVDDMLDHSTGLDLGSEIIYLIGGYDGCSWLSAMDSFSLSMDKLTSLKRMNSARSYASASALNGSIYVVGGGDGSSWSNTVERYDPWEDQWTLCPHLIRAKGSLAGATLNGKIFAIGGGDGFNCFSDVEMFDPALGRWINNRPMFEKRFAPAAAELHGALYAVGGYNGGDYLRSAERCDPREAYWEKLPSMEVKRGCHSMAVFNDALYVMGGFNGEEMVSSVEVFEPRMKCWTMGEPMKLIRGYAAAAVVGDCLVVIGGVEDQETIIDSVECYKDGSGWTSTGLKAVGKRCFFSAIVP